MARKIAFARIADAGLSNLQRILAELLPDGKQAGHDWWALNPTRPDSNVGSFSVRLDSGGFFDQANGDKGKDTIGLWGYCKRLKMGEAAVDLAKWLGIDAYDGDDSAPASVPRGTVKQDSGPTETTTAPDDKHAKRLKTALARKPGPRERKPAVEGPRAQVLPIPAEASRPDLVFSTPTGAYKPTAFYPYRDHDGSALGVVARYMVKDDKGRTDKETVTWTVWRNVNNGALTWQALSFPDPLPLYGAEQLAKRPTDPVLVVEGEKCKDHARIHAPRFVPIAWPGGVRKVERASWWHLKGRDCILWPDADQDGHECMQALAACLVAEGAARVRVVSLAALATALGVPALAKGFDIADLDRPDDWLAAFLDSASALVDAAAFLGAVAPATTVPAAAPEGTPPPPAPTPTGGPVLDRDDPQASAQRMLDDRYSHGGAAMVRYYCGEWFRWERTSYRVVDRESIRAEVWRYLGSARVENPDGSLERFKPNTQSVNNVVDALGALVEVQATHAVPCWLDSGTTQRPRATAVIAFENGLLDLDAYLAAAKGQPLSFVPAVELLPHTPAWFSTNVLPYAYNPAAECERWETFIDSCASGHDGTPDQSWVRAIAMWFGLNMTSDTSQQKMAMFNGAPGSGKGTLARMLRAVVGDFNVVAPRMSKLDGQFSLWPFIGKMAAIFFDVRLGRSVDPVSIVEVLLSISGEDPITIDRKSKSMVTARLSTRITFVGNDVLTLPDTSNAIGRRLLVFPFRVSHEANADPQLERKLIAELPGIANWSLIGLRMMHEAGGIRSPSSGEDTKAEMMAVGSPVKSWAGDCCERHGSFAATVPELFISWKEWCEENGNAPGSRNVFGIKLRSAFPELAGDRVGESRVRVIRGIRLNPASRQIVVDDMRLD